MMGRLLLCILLLVAVGRAELVVRPVPGATDPRRLQVEGHRVSAYQVVSAIAEHLDWYVQWSPQDQQDLKNHFITLEVPDRHARIILELVATSVGKEIDLEPDLKTILVYAEASVLTRSGRRAMRERAVRSYREAMLDPDRKGDPLEIKGRLAGLFMKEEDFVAAAKEWREIVENREGRPASGDIYPRACLGAGIALEKAGKPDDARQFYLKVIRDFGESEYLVPALLGNSRCLYLSGRARDGVANLKRYLSNERYFKAYIEGRHEAALRIVLARGQFISGDHKACLETLTPVFEHPDLSPSDRCAAFLHAGLAALEAGEKQRAVGLLGSYLKTVAEAERSSEAWLALGEALSACGRPVEALAALVELDSANLEAPFRRRLAFARSGVEMRLGRAGRAAEVLEKALSAAGGPHADPHLCLALARARQEAGAVEEARRLFRALLEDPGKEEGSRGDAAVLDEARIGLVGSLAAQGYHEDALAEARQHLPHAVTEEGRRLLYQAMLDAMVRAGRLEDAVQEVFE